MKRLDVIDGMRGYFLVFMLLNHLVFAGGLWLVEINHRNLAFVEDAQGFVFLSGLLTGMVYSRKMLRDGYRVGQDRIYSRVAELYRYAMGIILVILALKLFLPGAAAIWTNWLGDTRLDDPLRLGAIATFLFQPTFMDILPQYIIYMLAAPLAIWLCINGRWSTVAIASLLLWMAAQLGLQRVLTVPLNEWLSAGREEEGLRASFNLLGWQIVFFSGIIAGSLTAVNKVEWSKVFDPRKTRVLKVAIAVCLFFLPLRVMTAHGLMPGIVLEKFGLMEVRADFGPVYLMNFAAVGYMFAWTLIAGPKHADERVRRIAQILTAVFSLRYLQLLGRHSLQIYVWHVLIVYLVFYVDGHTSELSQLTKTAIALVGLAVLSLPAVWRERDRLIGEPPTASGGVKVAT
ncbi:OpgC domain-containing protein [Ciceribacter sp. L1K23]|uniref:OpgC family protein n=1 Tax=Ciceribacter sp. L1K23 TaxID=2820276 RepID=UPI001B819E4C|nr:OpgC domain-containing protein [Ciceribacter sp. L1K23]